MANRKCWVDGCEEVGTKWGMCGNHVSIWMEHVRTPRTRLTDFTDQQKFDFYTLKTASKAVREVFGMRPDCWLWTAGLSVYGYAVFRSDWAKGEGGSGFGHLYALVNVAGIERDLSRETDHLCRIRPCVNPEHLEQVTQWENTRRGVGIVAENSRETHCDQGHEFSAENAWTDSKGWRRCRECGLIATREYNSRPEVLKARREAREPVSGVRGKGQYMAERDKCDQGHPYEGDNLIEEKKVQKGVEYIVRRCRECKNEKARKNHALRMAKKRGLTS